MASVPQPFKNISATTPAFTLDSGYYGFDYVSAAWGGGNAQLQKLGADGATYVPALTSWTANGAVPAWLPGGTYKLVLTTVTALYVTIALITRGVLR